MKAIRLKCLDCVCHQEKLIRECTSTTCALYPYRMGKYPGRHGMSPTVRSLQHLRELGYRPAVVEKTIPRTYIKQDCFGADLIALKPGSPVLAIQTTTGSNHAARKKKLETEGFIDLWTSAGAVLEIWSWEQQGPRGQRKTWTLRREALT
jgi:hypothetical protein